MTGRTTPSEYDVVSFQPRPGLASLACGIVTMVFAVLLDDLPFVLGGRLRPYLGVAVLGALGVNALGIVLGVVAAKRPDERGAGRLGVLVNAVVLVLLALFVLFFRRIRWGAWI